MGKWQQQPLTSPYKHTLLEVPAFRLSDLNIIFIDKLCLSVIKVLIGLIIHTFIKAIRMGSDSRRKQNRKGRSIRRKKKCRVTHGKRIS